MTDKNPIAAALLWIAEIQRQSGATILTAAHRAALLALAEEYVALKSKLARQDAARAKNARQNTEKPETVALRAQVIAARLKSPPDSFNQIEADLGIDHTYANKLFQRARTRVRELRAAGGSWSTVASALGLDVATVKRLAEK